MQIEIAPADRSDAPECARLLAQALQDDRVMHRLIPGRDRLARMEMVLLSELRDGALMHGALDMARDESGRLLGVAAWSAPVRRRRTLTESLLHARERVRRANVIGLSALPTARSAERALARRRPGWAHWYLEDIGVAEHARGLGVGAALLTHGTARADAERMPAYLEATTPDSRRLYERHGFHALASIHLGGGACATSMLRPGMSARR